MDKAMIFFKIKWIPIPQVVPALNYKKCSTFYLTVAECSTPVNDAGWLQTVTFT